MTQTAWQQFKHNWITFAVTATFAIIGYSANKLDNFMDDYSQLTRRVMIHEILDSVYKCENTTRVNTLVQQVGIIQDVLKENNITFYKPEAVIPKRQQITDNK